MLVSLRSPCLPLNLLHVLQPPGGERRFWETGEHHPVWFLWSPQWGTCWAFSLSHPVGTPREEDTQVVHDKVGHIWFSPGPQAGLNAALHLCRPSS
eukprot:superscaffoldBa00003563_g17222